VARPGVHLVQECLLGWLWCHPGLDQDQHRDVLSGLPVLLVGCREARWLEHTVPLPQQEHDQVTVADGIQTCLLGSARRSREVLGAHRLITQCLDGVLGGRAVVAVSIDDRTDKDLHRRRKDGAWRKDPRSTPIVRVAGEVSAGPSLPPRGSMKSPMAFRYPAAGSTSADQPTEIRKGLIDQISAATRRSKYATVAGQNLDGPPTRPHSRVPSTPASVVGASVRVVAALLSDYQ
jgi:hypothetical protein